MPSYEEIYEAINNLTKKNLSIDEELKKIFEKSAQQTLFEITNGADSEDFPDLVIINFIINATRDNIPVHEIKKFIQQLTDDDFDKDFNDQQPITPIIDIL